jgi:hypothetical protein
LGNIDVYSKTHKIGRAPGHMTSKTSSNPAFPSRKVNLHDVSAFDFLQAYSHQIDHSNTSSEEPESIDIVEAELPDTVSDDNDTRLINAEKSSSSKYPPGDIRRVVSKASKRFVIICEYYIVSTHHHTPGLSLVDRGANGGVAAGDDVRVLFKTSRTVDIKGIDNHQLPDIPIGTVRGVVLTQKGPVIAIMHQFALLGKGSSIHSPCQLESYSNVVND